MLQRFSIFFVLSLLMLRQVAPALPLYIFLFSQRKAKTPQHATRIAQHALCNTVGFRSYYNF